MPLKAIADRGIFTKEIKEKRRHMIQGTTATRVVQEQQEIIEKQGRLIADLTATLEQWENIAGFDGEELKKRAAELQREKGR